MAKNKFYAVLKGREGPKIYRTWDECKDNTSKYPGAVHKSFHLQAEAEAWLASGVISHMKPEPNGQNTTRTVYCIDSDSEVEIIERVENYTPRPPRGTTVRTPARTPKPFAPKRPLDDDSDIEIIDTPGPSRQRAPRSVPPKKQSRQRGPVPAASEIIEVLDDDHNQLAHPPPDPPATLVIAQLSPEQRSVLDRVIAGQNVFFTGSAGTGKSFLLREIIQVSQKRGGLAITASTGIAAISIGGGTLHSWAGIGLGEEEGRKYGEKFLRSKSHFRVRQRWQDVRTLIIDEISMIDGTLFDKLELIGRIVRESDRPFGGIQLVLCGDFCQLPPVPQRRGNLQIPAVFAFDAESWDSCIGRPVMLTRVFRQKDQDFVDMLNAMRFGTIDPNTEDAFKALSRKVEYTDGIEPTELYSTRSEVDGANKSRLLKLKGPTFTYQADDVPGVDANGNRINAEAAKRLLERLVAQKEIILKEGAQVMLLKNMADMGLVNGSVGVVSSFLTGAEALAQGAAFAIPKTDNGPGASIEQIVHRMPPDQKWPLVRFQNGVQLLSIRVDFTVNNHKGETEAMRKQVPLMLAWALSVHKSQGQTLERVRVDLGRTFEKGQAYVALSRATKMEQLEVLNFEAIKVQAHPRVIQWHDLFFAPADAGPTREEYDELMESMEVDDMMDDMMDDEMAKESYHF